MGTPVSQRRRFIASDLPAPGRAAVKGGILGNYVDQINIFLPVTALAPALPALAGPNAIASSVAFVVMATLLGRPVGALIFGRISDAVGRTATTRVAIAGTAACTFAIALIPDHTRIGAASMALVIALRFIGGVFLAGEYTSAIPLAMEWSRPRERGKASGLIMSMAPWAQATIAAVTVGLLLGLGPAEYAAWGWRMSFAAGGLASVAMLVYYTRHVADAPEFHRPTPGPAAPAAPTPDMAGPARVGLRDLFFGCWAGPFWQVFALMSGLWIMTNMTVIVLTGRMVTDVGLTATQASAAMVIASIGQAVVMAFTGHLSSRIGRRRFFVVWGLLALLAGPALWWWITSSSHGWVMAGFAAAALHIVTVCAYGPVGAYINERFPTSVRATAYGTAYSLSIVIPALYPYYLPAMERMLGHVGAPVALLALGAVLVAGAGRLGPRLSPAELDAPLEVVANRHGPRPL
ncbi:MAG: MFS transporter [Dermatophilus congolensis]|nr:MFS transporter [Dermatophilus congolensis]